MKNEISQSDFNKYKEVEGDMINQLLKHQVISSQEAALLTPEQIDELVLRLGGDGLDATALGDLKFQEKIRRNLNLSPEKNSVIDTEKRQQEIEAAQAEMEQYLVEIQETYPEIQGLIMHGSRFNAQKVPAADSDFDTILLLENGTPTERDTEEHGEYLNTLIDFIHHKKSPTGKEVQLNEFFTPETLQQILENPEKLESLNWIWTPEAVRYVGASVNVDGKELSTEEFTNYLRKHISQTAIQHAKEEMLNRVREILMKNE